VIHEEILQPSNDQASPSVAVHLLQEIQRLLAPPVLAANDSDILSAVVGGSLCNGLQRHALSINQSIYLSKRKTNTGPDTKGG